MIGLTPTRRDNMIANRAPPTSAGKMNVGLGVAIGIAISAAIGVSTGNYPVWIAVGAGIGAAPGFRDAEEVR